MVIIKKSLEEVKSGLHKQIDNIGLDDRVECSTVFLKRGGEEDFEKQINLIITKDDDE